MFTDLCSALGMPPVIFGMPESPLLTVAETSNYTRTTVRFVQRELRYRIPVVKMANRLFFYKHDVDRWLGENTEVPVA